MTISAPGAGEVDSRLARLSARWEVLRSRKGISDYDVACWARDVRDVWGAGRGDERADFLKRLGFSKSDMDMHRAMAAALDMVPSVAVWRALGGWCSELRRVSGISDSKRRAAACKAIVETREQVEATVPAPAVLSQTKRAIKATLDAEAPKKTRAANASAPRADESGKALAVVSGALRRLVDSMPILAGLLSDEEKAAAGIKVSKRKAS